MDFNRKSIQFGRESFVFFKKSIEIGKEICRFPKESIEFVKNIHWFYNKSIDFINDIYEFPSILVTELMSFERTSIELNNTIYWIGK
jgi:hypothetical protein